MKKYTAHQGQTIFDLALELYGSMEGLIPFLQLNGLEVNSEILPGQVLLYDDENPINKTIREEYLKKGIRVNTGSGYKIVNDCGEIQDSEFEFEWIVEDGLLSRIVMSSRYPSYVFDFGQASILVAANTLAWNENSQAFIPDAPGVDMSAPGAYQLIITGLRIGTSCFVDLSNTYIVLPDQNDRFTYGFPYTLAGSPSQNAQFDYNFPYNI